MDTQFSRESHDEGLRACKEAHKLAELRDKWKRPDFPIEQVMRLTAEMEGYAPNSSEINRILSNRWGSLGNRHQMEGDINLYASHFFQHTYGDLAKLVLFLQETSPETARVILADFSPFGGIPPNLIRAIEHFKVNPDSQINKKTFFSKIKKTAQLPKRLSLKLISGIVCWSAIVAWVLSMTLLFLSGPRFDNQIDIQPFTPAQWCAGFLALLSCIIFHVLCHEREEMQSSLSLALARITSLAAIPIAAILALFIDSVFL